MPDQKSAKMFGFLLIRDRILPRLLTLVSMGCRIESFVFSFYAITTGRLIHAQSEPTNVHTIISLWCSILEISYFFTINYFTSLLIRMSALVCCDITRSLNWFIKMVGFILDELNSRF